MFLEENVKLLKKSLFLYVSTYLEATCRHYKTLRYVLFSGDC